MWAAGADRGGCRGSRLLIPQVKGAAGRQNVVWGDFRERGRRNGAVLCLKDGTAAIVVYAAERLAEMDETITP